MSVLVLTRHGESEWNSGQLITGWSDPPLSDLGEQQARHAGASLAVRRVAIDRVYTSLLRRAAQTASIMMAAAAPSVRVNGDWRLNERHFGQLEGMTKAEVTATWGNAWRKKWRDDDLSPPPSLDPDDLRHPRHDPRYQRVPLDRLPGGERRYDMAFRVLEFWHERVIPDILAGQSVAVVSHLGPLRILAHHVWGPHPDLRPLAHWPNAETHLSRLSTRTCCAQIAGTAAR